MIQKIPYKNHEEWLDIRKKYLGGSDAAAVVGLNHFESPYSLWAKKTDKTPEFEGNLATKIGTYLEGCVAELFEIETGKKVRNNNFTLVNDEYPWACANVDRLVVGEDAGLEIKTTSALNLRRFAGGEYPDNYYAQCVHYLAVTGKARWYLAVLIGNNDFRIFTIERNQDEIDSLMAAEKDFWENYVLTNTPPPVDGEDPTGETIKTIYAEANPGTACDLFGLESNLVYLRDLKEQIAKLDKEKARVENIIKDTMQEAETGTTDGWKVSWKNQSRSTFQVKDFAADHPDIDLSQYYKTTTFRKFDIKETK